MEVWDDRMGAANLLHKVTKRAIGQQFLTERR
jgi:hypothetical protein